MATPLSPEEDAAIAARRQLVHEVMPDLFPFLRDLHGLGMFEGWRAVTDVHLLTEDEKRERAARAAAQLAIACSEDGSLTVTTDDVSAGRCSLEDLVADVLRTGIKRIRIRGADSVVARELAYLLGRSGLTEISLA